MNKIATISNFLGFFQFLVDKYTLLDPWGSGSTALVKKYTSAENVQVITGIYKSVFRFVIAETENIHKNNMGENSDLFFHNFVDFRDLLDFQQFSLVTCE